jgi:hypothetical protein
MLAAGTIMGRPVDRITLTRLGGRRERAALTSRALLAGVPTPRTDNLELSRDGSGFAWLVYFLHFKNLFCLASV